MSFVTADAGDDAMVMKSTREVKQPSIVKLDNSYFFVSGSKSVFHLDYDPAKDTFARELTEDEIDDLPENILYTGSQETFSADHEKAFQLLITIIANMNEMQQDFLSFPLASFLIHLSGHLYNEIQEVQNGYVTTIVVSGSGNTCRTGKSLMTNMWQLVFNGFKAEDQGISITPSALFSKLDKGIPYYSKYRVFLFNLGISERPACCYIDWLLKLSKP